MLVYSLVVDLMVCPPKQLASLGAWEARLITKGGLPVGSEGFRSVNQGSLSFNHPLSAVATLLRCCDLAGNAYFQGIGTAFGLEVIT